MNLKSRFVVVLALTTALVGMPALASALPLQVMLQTTTTPPDPDKVNEAADQANMAGRTASEMTFTLTDRAFVVRMTQANNFEIAAAQLALSKSTSADVKAYAQMMIDDHTKMGNALQSVVLSVNPTFVPPAPMSARHQVMLDRLNAATADFDEVYKSIMIASHQETLPLPTKFITAVYGNLAIKQTAQDAIPVITMHLDMAQKLLTSTSNPS